MIQPGGSDSAALDNVFEVLVRAGRDAPMAKTMLIPEAWSTNRDDAGQRIAPCTPTCNARDGAVGRPGRARRYRRPLGDGRAWTATACGRCATRCTDDGLLIVGSETGMVPLDEADDRREGPRRARAR